MDLGLEEIVTKEFDYLKSEHGFKCVQSGTWLVKYQSELVFVNIRFDGERSYELGCEIGRIDNLKGTLKVPFDLGDVVRSKVYSREPIKSSFQVTSTDSLEKFVKELAWQIRTYAKDLLAGSDESFNHVADLRDKEHKEYALETELRYMRSQLDIAWQKKDYKKVIELLSPLKEELERSELKKLHYAIKKVK